MDRMDLDDYGALIEKPLKDLQPPVDRFAAVLRQSVEANDRSVETTSSRPSSGAAMPGIDTPTRPSPGERHGDQQNAPARAGEVTSPIIVGTYLSASESSGQAESDLAVLRALASERNRSPVRHATRRCTLQRIAVGISSVIVVVAGAIGLRLHDGPRHHLPLSETTSTASTTPFAGASVNPHHASSTGHPEAASFTNWKQTLVASGKSNGQEVKRPGTGIKNTLPPKKHPLQMPKRSAAAAPGPRTASKSVPTRIAAANNTVGFVGPAHSRDAHPTRRSLRISALPSYIAPRSVVRYARPAAISVPRQKPFAFAAKVLRLAAVPARIYAGQLTTICIRTLDARRVLLRPKIGDRNVDPYNLDCRMAAPKRTMTYSVLAINRNGRGTRATVRVKVVPTPRAR